eukprot:comp17005_c0_seq1/m.27953 comp17005_c0_seq1/g.27953  ORF comp17005_c0_seq1/g.27953 comp17005_c0_seq1/m.27953 type:complete len:279 (-) comp17005_c0_seq1:102-938(-)
MGDISREERLAIATKFLLSAPPGEFDVVLRDVKELLGDNDLLSSKADGIFRAYHTDQMVSVTAPGSDHSILLTKYGEIDSTHYVDPISNVVVTVDHLTCSATGTRGLTESKFLVSQESVKKDLNDLVGSYVKDHFAQGSCGVVYATNEGGNVVMTVCIAGTKTSPRNFWSGRWRSVWSFTLGSNELKGNIKIVGHYYEEGNVQLNTSVDKHSSVASSSPNDIFEAIVKLENSYQNAIENIYVNMKAFQSLRRKLPIHAEKFNWDNLAAHRVAKDLNKK